MIVNVVFNQLLFYERSQGLLNVFEKLQYIYIFTVPADIFLNHGIGSDSVILNIGIIMKSDRDTFPFCSS